MRDRQPIVEATCSSAQVPTVAVIVNSYTPEPVGSINPTYYPAPSPGYINNIPQQQPAGKIPNFSFSFSKDLIFFF
jgi:hypothetical protein